MPDSLTRRYSLAVETTDDFIYEKPDEEIIVGVWLPGMFPSPLGHLRTSVKVEDDGDGLDGSVQAFERLGESNSMDDLGLRRPDTTEDDKRGAGYSVAAFNDTKGRVYRDDSMTVEIGRIQGDDPWYVEMI